MERYGLRFEGTDGVLDAKPYHRVSNKSLAIKLARRASKTVVSSNIARVWVESLPDGQGIVAFKTRFGR